MAEGKFYKQHKWLPTSIWDMPQKDKRIEQFAADRMGHGELYQTYRSKSDGLKKNKSSKGLSQFHPDAAKRIIEFWSEPGDWILDPFGGRVRAMIARMTGRNYYGYEISPKAYKDLIERLGNQSSLTNSGARCIIRNDDARNIDFRDKFSMVFTCPPYWNTEDYNKLYEENVEGQLSDIKDYYEFLKEYGEIIHKCYNALKPGKFAVFVVNDFRRSGELIEFHSHTISAFKAVGFKLHDIIIRKAKTNIPLKIDQCVENKFMVKEHEFIIVGKKELKE